MKKITKKESSIFVKTCEDFLSNEGGQEVESSDFYYSGKHYIFENDTLGKLAIKLDDESSLLYNIYSKFENEKLASTYFECNPHSGKYNLHTRFHDAPMLWLQNLLYHFKEYGKTA